MKRHRAARSQILLATKSKVVGCCRIGTVIIRGITFVYITIAMMFVFLMYGR